MAGAKPFPQPVSDIATGILDPLLRRRTGLSVALVQSWDEIAGQRLSSTTRPERIIWPKRRGEDDAYEPATLVIACSGAAALRLQHETAEIIGRVNAFLGFGAIGRVKIVQKPVEGGRRVRPEPRKLTDEESARIGRATAPIEDGDLRESLERLGASIARKARRT